MTPRRSPGSILEQALAEGRALTAAEGKKLFKPKPPTESIEQQRLVQRVRSALPLYPDLANFFAVPNQAGVDLDGGRGGIIRQKKMLAEGLAPGYPDTGLDVARGGYYGLRVELKRESTWRTKKGEPSPEQQEWHQRLARERYAMFIAWGTDAAWDVYRWYLGLPRTWAMPGEWKLLTSPEPFPDKTRQVLL
jgi:hypothetical protein